MSFILELLEFQKKQMKDNLELAEKIFSEKKLEKGERQEVKTFKSTRKD